MSIGTYGIMQKHPFPWYSGRDGSWREEQASLMCLCVPVPVQKHHGVAVGRFPATWDIRIELNQIQERKTTD
jgi:hypothetical protein